VLAPATAPNSELQSGLPSTYNTAHASTASCSTALFTHTLGSFRKVNRPPTIGIVRARQVSQETHLSDYKACVTAGAPRYLFHVFIGLPASLGSNTGNTLDTKVATTVRYAPSPESEQPRHPVCETRRRGVPCLAIGVVFRKPYTMRKKVDVFFVRLCAVAYPTLDGRATDAGRLHPTIAVSSPRRNLGPYRPQLRVVPTGPRVVSYRWLQRRNRAWFWVMLLGVLFGGLILLFTNLLSR
jgi:hypothetical protein